MPWQNNGDYYSFKQDAITEHAPSASGVYGLFNSRHLIAIGNAANVRDALLHHRRQTDFRFSRFEPSGFTFEICGPDRRDTRAQELVREYRPISAPENPIGIAALYRSWRAPNARAFQEVSIDDETASNKIVAIATKLPKAKQKMSLHLHAERFGVVGALCGLIFVALGLIGLVPYLKNTFATVVRNPPAIAESRRIDGDKIQLAQTESLIATEDGANETTRSGDVESSTPVEVNAGSPTEGRFARAQTASPESVAALKPHEQPKRQVAVSGWSVQAMATTDAQEANDCAQKLKAKGYEVYLVEADVEGKTWHRVRVGNFATRRDAENTRVQLAVKEGFRDAYIAGNDNRPTTIALNRS
jgi:cell division septation protein DedD